MSQPATSDSWSELITSLGVDRSTGEHQVVSPIDGALLGSVSATATTQERDHATAWESTSLMERRDALQRFAAQLEQHKTVLVQALCLESGYPIAQCGRLLTAAITHFDTVASTLRLPGDVERTARWHARGQVQINRSARHSLADDTAALASALCCGCAVSWTAVTGRTLVTDLILQLWHATHGDNYVARYALTWGGVGDTELQPPAVSHVWVTPSAPVERAIDAIVDGHCWQNGAGLDSVQQVLVDHSLAWEMEHRLRDALTELRCADPRNTDTQRGPGASSRVAVVEGGTPTAGNTWPILQLLPVSELPDSTHNAKLSGFSVFTVDQREIEFVSSTAGRNAARVCINCVPSEDLSLSPLAWQPWLRPQFQSVRVENPW